MKRRDSSEPFFPRERYTPDSPSAQLRLKVPPPFNVSLGQACLAAHGKVSTTHRASPSCGKERQGSPTPPGVELLATQSPSVVCEEALSQREGADAPAARHALNPGKQLLGCQPSLCHQFRITANLSIDGRGWAAIRQCGSGIVGIRRCVLTFRIKANGSP